MKTLTSSAKSSAPRVQRPSWRGGPTRAGSLLPFNRTPIRQILAQPLLQPKLAVSRPGDPAEREADRVAEQVMRMPEPPAQAPEEEEELLQTKPLSPEGAAGLLQRKCGTCSSGTGLCPACRQEEGPRRKPLDAHAGPLVARQTGEELDAEAEGALHAPERSGRTPGVSPDLPARLPALQGGGQPLPASARAFFEPRFGYDFSRVRVHTDDRTARAAGALHAQAFTVGRDIFFGAGYYAPAGGRGRTLLAHELVHTLQQGFGQPTSSPPGLEVQKADDPLEQEADAPAEPTMSSGLGTSEHPAPEFRGTREPIPSLQRPHLIQRAEVDDDPAFCFPPGGTPLRDSKSTINEWMAKAKSTSEREAIHIVNAIYKDLGTGTGVTNAEKRLAALPASQVRHVTMSESRYAGGMLWPVDPLSRLGLWAAGKIFVAPLINLCGVCVGTDKVGHFFQQGYEYFRLGQEIRARVEAMNEVERKDFLARLAGPAPAGLLGVPESEGGEPAPELELSPGAYPELIATAFAAQFGRWLEGFKHNLTPEDVKWLKSRKFIPWYYSEGIYGSGSTGVLSRADLQANTQGYWFYRDLWNDPSREPDICDYVGELWNERQEVSTFGPGVGTPRGPGSTSMEAESP